MLLVLMLSKFSFKKGTLWGALFFCSLNLWAQDWKDLQWQRLLVYRETLTGYESEADYETFFLSPEGKYRPEKELNALIEHLKIDDPDPKKNAYCRFPARVRWLKKYTEVPDSKVVCTDYEAFRKRLSAKSLSVVFSSYYLGNPASSFGHTFIRLGKQSNEERDVDTTATELLDTGINYGAITEGAHAIVFAIGGLTGYFSGNYNAVPYYYKVREYNDFETRDLWSYQLSMTQEEIDLIVDHIWELGHTKFDYYFLSENCSYHVLSILEAARPSLKLHAKLPRLYTIPSETLKALEEEKLVRKITFRPAPSTVFYHQLSLLTPSEQKEVKDLVFSSKPIGEHTLEKKALIYDTAISLVDFKYAKDIIKQDEKAQAIKRPLLVQRSKIPLRSPELDFSDKNQFAPHLGHGQKRLMIGGNNREGKSSLDLEWRFAFHDFMDYDIAYPERTTIEVMRIATRTDGKDFQIREVALVDVTSLGKWDLFTKSPAWKVKLGQWQTNIDGRDFSTQGVTGGYGLSYGFQKFAPYLFAAAEVSYVSEELHKMKFAYGTDAGVLVDFNHSWKFNSELQWRVHPWDESRWINELRYSNPSFGVGTYFKDYLRDGVQDFGLRLYKYL